MQPDTYAALLAELTAMGKAPLCGRLDRGEIGYFERSCVYKMTDDGHLYMEDAAFGVKDHHAHNAIRITAEDVLLDHGWLIYMRGDGLYVATPASGFYLSDDFTGPTIEEVLLDALRKIKETT